MKRKLMLAACSGITLMVLSAHHAAFAARTCDTIIQPTSEADTECDAQTHGAPSTGKFAAITGGFLGKKRDVNALAAAANKNLQIARLGYETSNRGWGFDTFKNIFQTENPNRVRFVVPTEKITFNCKTTLNMNGKKHDSNFSVLDVPDNRTNKARLIPIMQQLKEEAELATGKSRIDGFKITCGAVNAPICAFKHNAEPKKVGIIPVATPDASCKTVEQTPQVVCEEGLFTAPWPNSGKRIKILQLSNSFLSEAALKSQIAKAKSTFKKQVAPAELKKRHGGKLPGRVVVANNAGLGTECSVVQNGANNARILCRVHNAQLCYKKR
jgi:hypothetical protein